MQSQSHDKPDAARGFDEGDSEAETSGPASAVTTDRMHGTERASLDSDFAGTGSGRPSGTGQPFVTSDPGMADQPAEGGEDEVDE